ncbi:hypothetical protein GCM10023235_41760 [Kitasatospora terrestris]|uniref:Uncharacterized protein n=1 Tax=Kitasatospora terrestris TaxID=258051 RepID=A0ABP9DTE0_9ACTN
MGGPGWNPGVRRGEGRSGAVAHPRGAAAPEPQAADPAGAAERLSTIVDSRVDESASIEPHPHRLGTRSSTIVQIAPWKGSRATIGTFYDPPHDHGFSTRERCGNP